jgi:hypothetical protein
MSTPNCRLAKRLAHFPRRRPARLQEERHLLLACLDLTQHEIHKHGHAGGHV